MDVHARQDGPDPGRVRTLDDLSRELNLLRARAARGSRSPRVSLEELARRVQEPKSSIHAYVAGHRFAPSQVLDRIVIALGATPAEQREWAEAWFRVGAYRQTSRRESDEDIARDMVPHQLPSAVDCFAGRARQLADLDRFLSCGNSGVTVAVSGTAGAGKTALAVYWAQSRRERFPDGQLYVDLCGFDPEQPMQPGHALGRLLRALGMPNRHIARDVDERAAQYRSLLSGRRAVVVLDNARDTDQVRMLLPGPPSSAIVTSRDSLTGLVARHGAHRVEVGPLAPAEATQLLEILTGAGVDADDRNELAAEFAALAEHCAGLPLALRIAADLVSVRPSSAVRELVRALESSDHPLDVLEADDDARSSLRAVFSWSYRRLPLTAARAFRLIGSLSHLAVTPEVVAALLDTNISEAGRVLSVLSHAHLLTRDESGNYSMHRLLKAYAHELALSLDADVDCPAVRRRPHEGRHPDDRRPNDRGIPRPARSADDLPRSRGWASPGDDPVILLDRTPATVTHRSTTP